MKTITITLYEFCELSKEAKKRAIEQFSNVNVDYDWWEDMYEDAEQIGLEITETDIDTGVCKGKIKDTSAFVVANMILENHGDTTETYKTATNFLEKLKDIENRAKQEGKDGDEYYWFSDEINSAEENFLNALLKNYLVLLKKEYEWRVSEKAIIEIIEANNYDFTEEGKLF